MTNSEVSPTVQTESSPAQVPIVPSPPNSDASTIIQPEPSPPQVLRVPSPQNTDAQVQVQAVQSPIITAPIPQAPNPNYYPQTFPDFAPNSTPSFSLSDLNANPQQSLMDLMSEQTYRCPNQEEQRPGDPDLFDFSGF